MDVPTPTTRSMVTLNPSSLAKSQVIPSQVRAQPDNKADEDEEEESRRSKKNKEAVEEVLNTEEMATDSFAIIPDNESDTGVSETGVSHDIERLSQQMKRIHLQLSQ